MSKSDEKLKKIKKILKTYKLLTNLQKITIFFQHSKQKNYKGTSNKRKFFQAKTSKPKNQ